MRTKTISSVAALAAFIFGLGLAGPPAMARSRHHHHSLQAPAPAAPYVPSAYAQARDPAQFYPEHIEGGIRGNLPFNNQLRKMSDPLNANGGGG